MLHAQSKRVINILLSKDECPLWCK